MSDVRLPQVPAVTRVEPAVALVGHIAVPGDKSISHRALLIGALAEGETRVRGFGWSRDTESTVRALRALAVEIEEQAEDELIVHGVGVRGLRSPGEPIDAGNAGTLLRLLTGETELHGGGLALQRTTTTMYDAVGRAPLAALR